MPRYGPFIHQVYIADGFADDCDELIHRCLSAEKVDYHFFCKIWKEMNMGCLYEGRNLGAEIAELSEEVIHIGKHYMLKDTSNFEESAIGVFIVYALLHLQPYKGFAHLRVVPDDLPAINRIERVARRDKRYDVLYALGSILIKGPVQYHAAEREYGSDLPVRKYLEGFTSIDKLGVRPKGVFRRQNEELDILKELQILTQRYTHAKMMISEKAIFDRNLQYINPNFPKELETALMKLITGIHEDQYGILGEDNRGDISSKVLKSRQAIKEKAMKQDIKPVRHLVHVKHRKTDAATSGSSKNEDNKPGSSRTKESPKKKSKEKFNARSERKRRIPISPRALKKNRIRIKPKTNRDSTSEDDESDTDVIDLTEKTEVIEKSIASTSDTKQAVLTYKKKVKETEAVAEKEKEKENKNVKSEGDTEQVGDEKITVAEIEDENERELDIQIDTLPVLIRTEQEGRAFEIEIIDKQQQPLNILNMIPKRTYQKKESALQKISLMPGVSIEKITAAPVEAEPDASTSEASQLAVITEISKAISVDKDETPKTAPDNKGIGILCSKVEKRDLKRVHLQSKFKRLGMLPVANFNVVEEVADNDDDDDDNDSKDVPLENITLAPIED